MLGLRLTAVHRHDAVMDALLPCSRGIKLKPKTQQELKLHDQVCFVPPAPAVRQLIYQVRCSGSPE